MTRAETKDFFSENENALPSRVTDTQLYYGDIFRLDEDGAEMDHMDAACSAIGMDEELEVSAASLELCPFIQRSCPIAIPFVKDIRRESQSEEDSWAELLLMRRFLKETKRP
eukprot:CAMPEP_0196656978 /NCGR_PEP_ID=MMETSP1086-20130531/20912_1 /TAXON_ID=77921 /ORGANISM="Cyanoptyche  gloeocystis , Strain SAG4.97" /LENGTH=111 /DNA_ID=CAMNT_0041989937 /DNA_START=274 /DNA_END=609 /DNA_ORIENTATION=+